MNKKGLTFTLTTWLIIAIGVVALSTAGVITASYLSNSSSGTGTGTNKNTNTNPTSGRTFFQNGKQS
jgi:flagellar basal body-associated protein FliL